MFILCFFSRKFDALSGLDANDCTKVTFHCIVPKLLWEWDKNSRMYMRFQGRALGNWEYDVGEFKEGRYVCMQHWCVCNLN